MQEELQSWINKANENALKINSEEVEIYVHVLIYREEDLYIAHCLEFDLVVDGKSTGEVEDYIIDAISSHISFCIANENIDKIMNPAPQKYWNMFYFNSKTTGKMFRFPKDYSYADTKLPYLHDLIKEVNFSEYKSPFYA